jgi:hypothetical protein
VTGIVAYRVARLEREAADKSELRSALAAYGAAIDRLTLKVQQLPQSHGIEGAGWTSLSSSGDSRLADRPAVDRDRWSVEHARPGEVIAASNRLILVAPEPILGAMNALGDLIAEFDPGSDEWKGRWQSARNDFAAVSREVTTGDRRPKNVSRNMYPTPPNSTELD